MKSVRYGLHVWPTPPPHGRVVPSNLGRRVRAIASCCVIAAMAGCDSTPAPEPDGPTLEEVSGSYVATTFTTQESGAVTDRLAGGASISIVLTTSGTTTGRLSVPGGAEDGSDFDADLAGTWTLRADTVQFSHAADTFMRDMVFLFATNQLSGQETFSSTVVGVVLAKQ